MNTKKINTIGFYGGGRVTRILLEGFKRKRIHFDSVIVCDPNKETLDFISEQYSFVKVTDQLDRPVKSKIVVLAVHPQVIPELLKSIRQHLTEDKVILSLAPKITISRIKEITLFNCPVIRMIPNAPSIINQGYNPITFSENFDDEIKEQMKNCLACLGVLPEVEESKLEAYAIITGMGPAYFWFQINALYDLGVSFGLDESETAQAITDMIKGTVDTLFNSGLLPEQVMDLIPVKPLSEYEDQIISYFGYSLNKLYVKLKS